MCVLRSYDLDLDSVTLVLDLHLDITRIPGLPAYQNEVCRSKLEPEQYRQTHRRDPTYYRAAFACGKIFELRFGWRSAQKSKLIDCFLS